MNIERAIEFIIKNQARMDARFNAKFDRADQRMDRLERVVAQNNRVVTRLTRYGVSLRSEVRRTERNLAKVSDRLDKLALRSSETDENLNALIDIVDRHSRDNGRHK